MGKDLKGRELGVGISQRKDGTYTGRYTDRNGKRRQKYFKKLQECRQWIADAQFQNEHGGIDACGEMTVEAWFEFWITQFKEKKCKAHTIRNYRNRFRINIKEFIGKMLLNDVKPLHCQNVLINMEDKYCNSTIEIARNLMYCFFEDALENELIMRNPVTKGVICITGKKSRPRRVLTISEQRRLLQAARNDRYYNIYAVLLQTGLRIGELIGMQWKDIDFKNRMLHVQRTAKYVCDRACPYWEIDTTKSKAGDRTIPLTQEAINILLNQRERNKKIKTIPIEFADYVFITSKGKPMINYDLNVKLRQLCERAGIEVITVHELRHTFATRCIEAEMNPKTLQKILGHARLEMTMDLYVHVTEEKKKQEIVDVEEKINVM